MKKFVYTCIIVLACMLVSCNSAEKRLRAYEVACASGDSVAISTAYAAMEKDIERYNAEQKERYEYAKYMQETSEVDRAFAALLRALKNNDKQLVEELCYSLIQTNDGQDFSYVQKLQIKKATAGKDSYDYRAFLKLKNQYVGMLTEDEEDIASESDEELDDEMDVDDIDAYIREQLEAEMMLDYSQPSEDMGYDTIAEGEYAE